MSPAEAKVATTTEWQLEWTANTESAQWTKRLIPQLEPWLDCKHRTLDYYVTQFLSGHGSYRTYTKRIWKDETDACRYCGDTDTPEHTIFWCIRWDTTRSRSWANRRLSPENIVGEMVRSKEEWTAIVQGVRAIMEGKEKEERDFQSGTHPAPPPQRIMETDERRHQFLKHAP